MNNTTINSDENVNNVTYTDDFDRRRHNTSLSRLHRSCAQDNLIE